MCSVLCVLCCFILLCQGTVFCVIVFFCFTVLFIDIYSSVFFFLLYMCTGLYILYFNTATGCKPNRS
jgi:hypothetical protein